MKNTDRKGLGAEKEKAWRRCREKFTGRDRRNRGRKYARKKAAWNEEVKEGKRLRWRKSRKRGGESKE
jgi:hypothetical protein